jgi:hypothetical protein
MNAVSALDSPNNWRRGPGSSSGGNGAGGGGGGNIGPLGSSQPTSPFGGQPTTPYGGSVGGIGGPGSLSERDAARNNTGNNTYSEAQSPLSPSSDFSLSKYDHHPQQQGQRNLGYPSNNDAVPNSRSNTSLMSQRSSGADAQENIIIEHYIELHAYVTSNPPIDGTTSTRVLS